MCHNSATNPLIAGEYRVNFPVGWAQIVAYDVGTEKGCSADVKYVIEIKYLNTIPKTKMLENKSILENTNIVNDF